jgi:hypothetical protein
LLVRDSGSNRGFVQLRDGRLMAATIGNVVAGGRIAAPITSDPTGLTGWSGGVIDTSANSDVGEPSAWEGPDGTLHYASRGPNTAVWHSFSTDGGATWSALAPMPSFPDNPGNKQFGTLSNGWNWYIGNPLPGSRQELIFSISRDGYSFDESYVVRDEPITPIWPSEYKSGDRPGYEYPAAYFDEETDTLYLAYSRTRDYIEVTKVVNANLLPPRGDYNEDRIVDQADFAFWKSHFGESSGEGMTGDGNNNGAVDAADYVIWRNRLGETALPPVVMNGSGSGTPVLESSGDGHTGAALVSMVSPNVGGGSVADELGGVAKYLAAEDTRLDNLRGSFPSDQADCDITRRLRSLPLRRPDGLSAPRDEALFQLLLNGMHHQFRRLLATAKVIEDLTEPIAENDVQSGDGHSEFFPGGDVREDCLQYVFSAWREKSLG